MRAKRYGRLLVLLLAPSAVRAQATTELPLSGYLEAMAQARLLSTVDASASELRALVARGEGFYLAGRYDEAAVVLLEALEGPRFTDFKDFDEYAAAEHMAAQSLLRLGSHKSAWRYLVPIVARGPSSAYYGPGVRHLTDVALVLGNLQEAAALLARQPTPLSEDANNELYYLEGRIRYDAEKIAEAASFFTRITKRSRFYANAQYYLGAIASRDKRWNIAEQRFCAVAGKGTEDRYSFYVDDRFFAIQDLARLGLGRVAHERRRGEDAFYYYFQVPQDSPNLPEAMFEAAYASYESGEYDTAVDLLDQLAARFPDSAFVDEAAVLRGYASLGQCEFDSADRHFAQFIQRFRPLVQEIDRLLDNPVRAQTLYDALLLAQAGSSDGHATRRRLLGLLRVDPTFYRLHRSVSDLDAEAARAGRIPDALAAIAVRVSGSDRPKALAQSAETEREAIDAELERAATLTRALGEDLDALRTAGASTSEVEKHEQTLSKLAQRLDALLRRSHDLRTATDQNDSNHTDDVSLPTLLARDAAFVQKLPARVALIRERLVDAASKRAEQALRELRTRLDGLLRRAGIGRIDAVMGSKRRIERQIESLAAGRFPEEHRNQIRAQGLLADDEEYWPFEGEDWPDEFEERYDADDIAEGEGL